MARAKTYEQKKRELDAKYKKRERDLNIRLAKKYRDKMEEEFAKKWKVQEKNYERDLHNLKVDK